MDQYSSALHGYNSNYANAIIQNTFGHLASKKHVTYPGRILFSISSYGGGTSAELVDMDFKGLNDSTWLYDAVRDYINGRSPMGLKKDRKDGVYLFEGSITNYLPKGKIKLLYSL